VEPHVSFYPENKFKQTQEGDLLEYTP